MNLNIHGDTSMNFKDPIKIVMEAYLVKGSPTAEDEIDGALNKTT